MLIGHSGQYYEAGERHRIALLFDERGWRHMDGSTSPGDTPVAKEVRNCNMVPMFMQLSVPCLYFPCCNGSRDAGCA